jgi:vacuolar-type H+-ATPase subunit H
MGLDRIIKTIIDDAQAEADKILLKARSKAETMREHARMEAAEIGTSIVKEAERQGRLEASRIVTDARLAGKREVLSLKRGLIENAINLGFQSTTLERGKLKRTIILKDGETEEPYGEESFREELRTRFEREIAEALRL